MGMRDAETARLFAMLQRNAAAAGAADECALLYPHSAPLPGRIDLSGVHGLASRQLSGCLLFDLEDTLGHSHQSWAQQIAGAFEAVTTALDLSC